MWYVGKEWGWEHEASPQFCWLWGLEMKCGNTSEEASPFAQVLNLFPDSLTPCAFLWVCTSALIPTFNSTEVACELGRKERAPMSVQRCRHGHSVEQKKKTHRTYHWHDSTCTLKWKLWEPSIFATRQYKASPKFLQAGGLGGVRKVTGWWRESMMETQASKMLYSLLNSNFPPKPNSFLTL